ncbi:DUF3429 domain-containing protein [Ottowia testudinis]|uniref:DUF3429 domain-containing protein n=1 Tax=Ottowia testudinis TaxID=2816950 RepID=A0A975CI27_9BURK|nr:DUF3429 domain-containing protein [Ottowia testudinis]QTD46167.1 DUF3429 domain-containing protein [Ottowia testudinis]
MTDADRPPLPGRPAPRWRLIYFMAWGALAPMALMAMLLWWRLDAWHAFLAGGLASYAAMLASFVGGFHWGIGLRYMATTSEMPTFHFVWGPVPAYLAWGAFLLQPWVGLPLLALILVLSHLMDARTWPGSGLGPWLPLRRQITTGAVACCLLGAAALLR